MSNDRSIFFTNPKPELSFLSENGDSSYDLAERIAFYRKIREHFLVDTYTLRGLMKEKSVFSRICQGLFWFSAIAASTAILFTADSARACTCAEQTIEEAVKNSAAIFEGRVIEIKVGADENGVSTRTNQIRFRIVRSWKGVQQEEIIVRTMNNEAACGYGFRANQSYLVFADGNSSGLLAGLCSRTKPIEKADEEIRVLGMGEVPVSPQLTEQEKRVLIPSARRPAERAGCASCGVLSSRGTNMGTLGVIAFLFVYCYWRRCEKRRVGH
jgi:hypothetical protein